MGRRRTSPVNQLFAWVRKQSVKVKTALAVSSVLFLLVALKFLIRDHNYFFIASEFAHFIGIVVLIYKLTTQNSCSGLSMKSQDLTAIFLGVRLFCSIFMESDIHTLLDFATLVSTVWVMYMMRYKLKSTYIEELDNMHIGYLLVPCAVVALFIHPYTQHYIIYRVLWAFCVYLEAISVLPQLRMMQNTKMVEPFTANYVFALGVARFLSCAHWIIQVYETSGKYLFFLGAGYLWVPMVLLAEVVQTFILADFCYYYVKSVINGQLMVSLPRV